MGGAESGSLATPTSRQQKLLTSGQRKGEKDGAETFFWPPLLFLLLHRGASLPNRACSAPVCLPPRLRRLRSRRKTRRLERERARGRTKEKGKKSSGTRWPRIGNLGGLDPMSRDWSPAWEKRRKVKNDTKYGVHAESQASAVFGDDKRGVRRQQCVYRVYVPA